MRQFAFFTLFFSLLLFSQNSFSQAGPDKIVSCSSINLDAANPSPNIGIWTVVGSQVIISPTLFNSQVTNLQSGVNTFTWTVPGIALTDFVDITYLPTSAGAGGETCDGSFLLNGSNPSPGTGKWTIFSGNGIFDNTASATATVSALDQGDNVLVWSVTIDGCTSSAQVTITNNQVLADAGPDQIIYTSTTQLHADQKYWDHETGYWTAVTSGTMSHNTFFTTVSNINTGINEFIWTLERGTCSSTDNLFVNYAANAGVNTDVCNSSGVLNAIGPTIGQWSTLSGTLISNLTSYNTTVSNLDLGENVFTWTTNIGTGNVSIIYAPLVTSAGPDQTVTENAVTFAATPPEVGEWGQWKKILPVTITLGTLYNETRTGVLSSGLNEFEWTLNNGDCTAKDSVIITFDNSFLISAGPDQTICGSVATLGGENPFPGNGIWTVNDGGSASFINQTQYNTAVGNMQLGANEFKWSVTRDGYTAVDIIIVTVDEILTQPTTENNKGVCTGETTITGNNILLGTGTWATAGNAIISQNTTNYIADVTNLDPGINIFTWTVTGSSCTIAATLEIEKHDINAGADQTVTANSVTLAATPPQAGDWGEWNQIAPTTYHPSIRNII